MSLLLKEVGQIEDEVFRSRLEKEKVEQVLPPFLTFSLSLLTFYFSHFLSLLFLSSSFLTLNLFNHTLSLSFPLTLYFSLSPHAPKMRKKQREKDVESKEASRFHRRLKSSQSNGNLSFRDKLAGERGGERREERREERGEERGEKREEFFFIFHRTFLCQSPFQGPP